MKIQSTPHSSLPSLMNCHSFHYQYAVITQYIVTVITLNSYWLKVRKINFIYLYLFLLWYSSFLNIHWSSDLWNFSFAWKAFFKHFLWWRFVGNEFFYFCFCLSENIFVSPSSLKDNVTGCRILGCFVLFFNT